MAGGKDQDGYPTGAMHEFTADPKHVDRKVVRLPYGKEVLLFMEAEQT
jgi:hypothetical protein